MKNEPPSDEQLVDFLLEAYSDAVKAADGLDQLEETVEEEADGSADILVSDIITSFFDDNENIGVLGNYVLVAEVIDDSGKGELVVLTSDNLPTWVSRGMLLVADEHLMDAGECE